MIYVQTHSVISVHIVLHNQVNTKSLTYYLYLYSVMGITSVGCVCNSMYSLCTIGPFGFVTNIHPELSAPI